MSMNLETYDSTENESKETLQKRHYFLFEQLQLMVNQVPL